MIFSRVYGEGKPLIIIHGLFGMSDNWNTLGKRFAEKFNVHIWLEKLLQNDLQLMQACNIDDVNGFHSAYSVGERTRSFLKVQDGCDYSCTCCTIPLARGKSRSDDLSNVIINAKELVNNGVKEIVLRGISLGDYG